MRKLGKASAKRNRKKAVKEKEEMNLNDKVNALEEKLNDLYTGVADLSSKIILLNSSLREFEKQRINPQFEEINKMISLHNKQLENLIDYVRYC